MATFTSNSAAETEAIGLKMARELGPGSVLALRGELGAGKTAFTKGLVAGLGSKDVVTSPTFTIVHEYTNGRIPVYHCDFFRLETAGSFNSLGLNDYFFGQGISIVEWADRFPQIIPAHGRWITFEIASENQRIIRIE